MMITFQQKQSVLLIDDDGVTNFINYRLIKRSLLSEKIFTAYNGLEGLDCIRNYALHNFNNCPELIILDINMPHVDGFQFLEAFYQSTYKNSDSIKIIILTNSIGEDGLAKLGMYRGKGISLLNKPLTLEKLREALC